jgi:hypothetical protein
MSSLEIYYFRTKIFIDIKKMIGLDKRKINSWVG